MMNQQPQDLMRQGPPQEQGQGGEDQARAAALQALQSMPTEALVGIVQMISQQSQQIQMQPPAEQGFMPR